MCKTFSIYRTDLTNGDTVLVRGDGLGRYDKNESSERYDGVIAIGDTLYYSMRTPKYGIFRYNESGNDEIIVDTKEDSHLKLSGARNDDCFYYIVYDKIESDGHSYSSTIYEYSENGSRELMHIDNHISSFTVTDSYIFYQLSQESPVEAYLRTDQ